MYGARRRFVTIPAAWFCLLPGKPLAFWMRVRREVRKSGIRSKDLVSVRDVARTVEATTTRMKRTKK
jgi:hypothetical protein